MPTFALSSAAYERSSVRRAGDMTSSSTAPRSARARSLRMVLEKTLSERKLCQGRGTAVRGFVS
jgi:hypothetical protein